MNKPAKICLIVIFYVAVLGGLLLSAVWGSEAVTTISEKNPLQERMCVIIDAGHGGEDGGATSCTGILESKLNLEIALRLEDLMHLLGIDTLMIRKTDRSVYTQGTSIAAKKVSDLKERVRIVNETQNALLLSIHQNFFADSRYSGAQIFYANAQDSKELANDLQSALAQALMPNNSRQIKKANGVYLMEHIDCTGVLVECGFLSNPVEEALLRDACYQKKLSCVIAATVCNYLDQHEIH